MASKIELSKRQQQFEEAKTKLESINSDAGVEEAKTRLQTLLNEASSQETALQKVIAKATAQAEKGESIADAEWRKIEKDVPAFTAQITELRQGLDIALDSTWRPPSRFAWITFGVLIAAFVLVAAKYVQLHGNAGVGGAANYTDRLEVLRISGAAGARATALDYLQAVDGELQKRLSAPKTSDELKSEFTSLKTSVETSIKTLQDEIGIDLEIAIKKVKALPLPEGRKIFYDTQYESLKNWVTAKNDADLRGSVIAELANAYGNQVDKDIQVLVPEFFWEKGAGRYAEILFGAFFGVMVFAIYNWWKHMSWPNRQWWLGWTVAKVFLALVISFTFVAILSQVNFTTPSSLESQTAFGLGTAPMELVFAVAIIAGYFGHRTSEAVQSYADRLFRSTGSSAAGSDGE